jgi:hypothetical protein
MDHAEYANMTFSIPQTGWYRIGEYEYFFDQTPEDGIKLIINPETFEVEPETFKMKRKV